MIKSFDDVSLRNISNILSELLKHKEITEHLSSIGMIDSSIGQNKSNRLYFALKEKQNQDKCGNNVLGFVANIISPKRYNSEVDFEKHRSLINEKLLYDGIEIDPTGQVKQVDKAKTISEAKRRSNKIKEKVNGISIHPEIIQFCEKEWLQENYFHAILEITKSVAEVLRNKSGLKSDGAELIDACLGLGKDNKPMLAINTLSTPSELSEHKGFGHFCKGFFSMYRNPKAHNPKALEETQLSEMIEVLIVASIIHNKLDNTFKTGYL